MPSRDCLRRCAGIALALLPLSFCAFAQTDPGPTPGWSVSASVRLRAESLAESFRLLAPEQDHLYFSRTQLGALFQASSWSFEFEVQDSRAWGIETLSPVGTDDVNSLEPINLKLSKQWAAGGDSTLDLTVGRMTLDYGSRRLLARNNFRNTSNAFQGVQLTHSSAASTAQVFYTLPLQRQPDVFAIESLRDNEFRLDKAGRGARFFGGIFDHLLPGADATLGAYVFGSELKDQPGRLVADRELTTLGSRLTWKRGRLDTELEAAYQWGESLASLLSSPSDQLQHRAWFSHLHLGMEVVPGVNLALGYDHATGDRDPFDGRNERFDRLYGARAFDLGPSGIFGAAVRSNLRSPFLRLRWKPTFTQSWLLSYRWLSLDSSRDFFVTGARRDLSGASGREIGGQWELRWRWNPLRSAFDFELGGAYLDKGEYFDGGAGAALNPPSANSSQYLFAQLQWHY
ncbi:alginate export family protein [Congregibacter sp.]|uniref:alginate export family protein n=1 Tax=Congregibacter sp. TaxID=2744308 RepID=UPI003F6B8B08